MRLQTFLAPVTLLTSVLSFRPDVPSLDSRQVPCNESNDWSEWNQNCCVGGMSTALVYDLANFT